MPFTLATSTTTVPVQRAWGTVPRHCGWSFNVTLAGPLDLAAGTQVVLTLGDTAFAGYVVTGGPFAGADEYTYLIGAGVGGWTKAVAAKSYQGSGGAVSLLAVATALAAEAGEQLAGVVDAPLGDHWQRPAGPASLALSALFPLGAGGWRIDPSGIASPGVRPPAPVPVGTMVVVTGYVAAERRARIALQDDAISSVLPGAIVTAGNLASPIVVSEATIRASMDAVVVDVLGEGGIVEMLAALVQALTPAAMLAGPWTYAVVDDAGAGRPNLRALNAVAGLPPVLACAEVFGLPGVSAQLATGALVLVGFRDGSPTAPFVLGFLPGVTPATLALDAGSVTIGASAAAVNLGGATAPVIRVGDVITVGTQTGAVVLTGAPSRVKA